MLFFLLGFVSLRNLNLPETEAFVMAAVIAQVAVIWRNLPDAARELRRVGVQSMTVLRYGVAASIAAAAAQILLNDPTITQRMISMSCVVYAGAMLWGVLGNARIRDLVVPFGRGACCAMAQSSGEGSMPVTLSTRAGS